MLEYFAEEAIANLLDTSQGLTSVSDGILQWHQAVLLAACFRHLGALFVKEGQADKCKIKHEQLSFPNQVCFVFV